MRGKYWIITLACKNKMVELAIVCFIFIRRRLYNKQICTYSIENLKHC